MGWQLKPDFFCIRFDSGSGCLFLNPVLISLLLCYRQRAKRTVPGRKARAATLGGDRGARRRHSVEASVASSMMGEVREVAGGRKNATTVTRKETTAGISVGDWSRLDHRALRRRDRGGFVLRRNTRKAKEVARLRADGCIGFVEC